MVLVSEQNIDDLLTQLKAEFETKSRAELKANNSPARKSPPPSSQASMEHMLDELKTELESVTRGDTPVSPSSASVTPQKVRQSAEARQRLNAAIDKEYQKQAAKREAKLEEIKRQEAARLAEQQRRQQELIEAQKREELRERRRKAAMREKARQWLKNLNPRSEEGQWFEEFSYSYEDKLQAAIDYLEAMRETGLY